MRKAKNFSINKPWAITVIYMIIGVSWIFFSDIFINSIFSDDIQEMSRFQMIKGFLYVLLTGLLLYYLINRLYNRINGGKQELELLFTNPNLGIFKVDKAGNFTYVSPNISQIIGYSDRELIGKNVIDLTPEKYRGHDLKTMNKIKDNPSDGSFIVNKYLKDKDGKTAIIKIYGISLKNKKGQLTGYLAAFQNITVQETFLKNLESKNKHLKELASDQSHLVRAPLARILGIIELVQNVDLTPGERSDLIKHIKSSGEELDKALKDISRKMISKEQTAQNQKD